MNEYVKLDISKLNFSSNAPSYDEVINATSPMLFNDNVVSDKNQIKISNAEKDYKNKCVKLEVFY